MSVKGIGRVQAFLGGIIDAKDRPVNASADRDTKRDEQEQRRKKLRLSEEQIQEAFEELLETLSGTTLRAEKHMENDSPHFQVFDANNKVIRDLRLPHIIDFYFRSKSGEPEQQAGTLLKRSA